MDNDEIVVGSNKIAGKVKSIDKACKIVDLVSQSKNGIRLSEISKKMDLSLSSAHHIIGTLITNRLLYKN